MFERSSVVLVRAFICRSRTSARGLEGAREQRAARGLVGVFEHLMKTCSAEFAGQRRRRAPRTSKERSLGSRSMEGTSGLKRPVALTWTGWSRLRRWASGRSRSAPSLAKGVRGLDSTEPPSAEKATALSPRKVLRHRSWWSVDPKPAACRQARGRWRLNDRKVVQRVTGNERRKRRVPGASLEVSHRRVSHGLEAGSLQKWCSITGARNAKRRL